MTVVTCPICGMIYVMSALSMVCCGNIISRPSRTHVYDDMEESLEQPKVQYDWIPGVAVPQSDLDLVSLYRETLRASGF